MGKSGEGTMKAGRGDEGCDTDTDTDAETEVGHNRVFCTKFDSAET